MCANGRSSKLRDLIYRRLWAQARALASTPADRAYVRAHARESKNVAPHIDPDVQDGGYGDGDGDGGDGYGDGGYGYGDGYGDGDGGYGGDGYGDGYGDGGDGYGDGGYGYGDGYGYGAKPAPWSVFGVGAKALT